MLIVGEDGIARKFSCEKCIKGHRTSGCKHANSPLIEIKKKGRPSTQCEQCKELRKTKHMHVKCICSGNKPESRSRIRPTPYSREPSPNHSRESSPLHMDLDIGNNHQIVGGNMTTDLSDTMYTSSVSSEGTMTPTESSSSCSPSFSGNISNETPHHPHVAQDGDPMDALPDEHISIRTTTEKLAISTPIDPFKLRYHLQRTLNITMLHTPSSTSIHSVNSPLYSPVTSPRTPPIPINDPTDDLDSDTPLYKTDGEQVDQAAVLGDLHHTSSEDLMDEIYSGFTDKNTIGASDCGANCQCGDSCECAGCTLHGSLTDSLPEGHSNHIRNIRDNPTKSNPIIDEDGVQLCGCGCMKSLESCRDCFQDLCEEYLLNHPHP